MTAAVQSPGVDSAYAWRLAFVSMLCITLGGGALYLPVVALKEMAAEFGERRAVPEHDQHRRENRGENCL